MPVKGRIEVNELYCKGCELCADSCPQGIIGMAAERLNAKGYHPAEMIKAGCNGCGICAIVCPEAAISVFREVTQSQTDEKA
jgi:2-oxoglutarate ferredoxin oxidoreductase subunit delta